MKRVSFKVAKALKAAGYPQEYKGYRYTTRKCRGRYLYSPGNNAWDEFDEGELVDENMYHLFQISSAYAPTYLDVWLWLWREKGTPIQVDYSFTGIDVNINDPEDAIISSIEDLVDNNLIK